MKIAVFSYEKYQEQTIDFMILVLDIPKTAGQLLFLPITTIRQTILGFSMSPRGSEYAVCTAAVHRRMQVYADDHSSHGIHGVLSHRSRN